MARAMKDSGIEWIGEIPAEWEVLRGKVLFRQRNEKGNSICLQLLSPTQKFGVIPQAEYERLTGMKAVKLDVSADYTQLKTIHAGDFCISLRSFQGGFEYSCYEGVVSPAYQVFYSILDSSDRYFKYLFKDQTFIDKMNSFTLSLRDGKNIAFDDFANTYLPFPPVEEQARIADFLDAECARIDAVIAQTRASIEEYKKLKQAIITEAVTRGIRPGRKMKPSGIEWIGEIPEEWTCQKFKYVASVKANLVQPDDYLDLPQVSPENIEKGSGKLLPCKTVREAGVISGNHLFFSGQILYSKIRPKLNKVVIAPFDGLCSADMYPIETQLDTEFLAYAMRSDTLLAQVSLITEDRVKMPKINQEELGDTYFAIPPADEQREISHSLNITCAYLDEMISKKEALIAELESYKKTLIFEYVTGKKEVSPAQETVEISFVEMRALLMCRIIELMKPKGRIHLQKALYTIDCLSGANDQTQYIRQTHGPYDPRIEEYESAMGKHGWATSRPGASVEYRLGEKYAEYRELYQRYYHDIDPLVKKACIFLRPMKTSQAERVATLLAVWNDLLLDGETPTDTEIVQEVRSHWTPNKAHSEEATWFDTLRKIKKNGLIPKGMELHTIPKAEG